MDFGILFAQEDLLFGFLTVEESIRYAAGLQLRCSKAERDAAVEDVPRDPPLPAPHLAATHRGWPRRSPDTSVASSIYLMTP